MSENKEQPQPKDNVDKKPPEQNQQQAEEQPGFFRKYMWYIIIFVAFRIGTSIFGKNNSNEPKLTGILEEGTKFDVNFYLSPKDHYTSIKNIDPIYTIKDMIFSYKNFSSYSFENEINVTYNISYLFRRKNHKNSRLYLISEIKLDDDIFKRLNRYHGLEKEDLIRSINILKYVEDLTGLLNSGKDIDDISVGRDFKKNLENSNKTNKSNNTNIIKEEPIPKLYYKNNFYLYIVKTDKQEGVTIFQTYNILKVPLRINTQRMEYLPIMALSDFWSMDSELVHVNKTESGFFTFKLYLSFNYIKSFFFNNMLGIQINEQIMYEKMSISGTKDMLVELIKNNSTFYLIILFTVNTLHTIFSYLGFSSDISYYKNLKKLDGVYTKYIFFNIFYMFITLIYILLQGANFIVKIELFISFVIEIWKLKKIFKISFTLNNFPYIIKLEYKQTFEQEEAKDYESEAVSMMVKYLLFPIGVIYLGYRIYYYSDNIVKNNWKSIVIFIIEYIYFLLNVFGFILLTPQIYLNYKLQSVEHLPMKAMTYKFLNTIIDDLYAFAVKTPTMYRIFCFRDDVIFVIYIYQIFKYRKNSRAEQIEKQRQQMKEEKKKLEAAKEQEKEKTQEKGKEKEKEKQD
jgi:hypothetical protein